jgi:hypothetical protein
VVDAWTALPANTPDAGHTGSRNLGTHERAQVLKQACLLKRAEYAAKDAASAGDTCWQSDSMRAEASPVFVAG